MATENTQASVGLLHEIRNQTRTLNGQTTYDSQISKIHDQDFTFHCYSYAIISAFRKSISEFLENLQFSDPTLSQKCNEITLALRHKLSDSVEKQSLFEFSKMWTAFLGSVNPRSFNTSLMKQAAFVEKSIARLVCRTAFECEGWKRILPVRSIFDDLKLKIDKHELLYEKLQHPSSFATEHVLQKCSRGQLNWAKCIYKYFQVQYFVYYI